MGVVTQRDDIMSLFELHGLPKAVAHRIATGKSQGAPFILGPARENRQRLSA